MGRGWGTGARSPFRALSERADRIVPLRLPVLSALDVALTNEPFDGKIFRLVLAGDLSPQGVLRPRQGTI